MSAYDELYVSDAMKNLGEAFDYAFRVCGMAPDDFMNLFIAGGVAELFGKGNPEYVAGKSGTELVMDILDETGDTYAFPEPLVDYEMSREYWAGWMLAYFQWETGMSFRTIREYLTVEELMKLYPTLKDASRTRAALTLNAMIHSDMNTTRLQKQRKLCGYSQKELAEKADVNLRTLQQYELGAKDLGKASVQTVLALARVLGCQAEDILTP